MFNNQYNPYQSYMQPQFNTQQYSYPTNNAQNYQNIGQNSNLIQQNAQLKGILQGKLVDSADVVKAMDIPLDGSISYYPLVNGDAILTKQVQNDGKSKIVVYKKENEVEEVKPKYVTIEDLKELREDIKQMVDELKVEKSE